MQLNDDWIMHPLPIQRGLHMQQVAIQITGLNMQQVDVQITRSDSNRNGDRRRRANN